MPHDMNELTIERLGHLGDGIAPGPIYASRTLPDEVVRGTLEGDRLTDVRIVTPSSDRVAAPCRHYKSCGGCAVQHASEAFVAHWKMGIVEHALAAQDVTATFRPLISSAPHTRRRATFSGRRTKKGALVGFHSAGSTAVIAVPECLLVTPALLAAIPIVEEITILGGSRKGELSLTVTETRSGLDISVTNGKPMDTALEVALGGLVNKGRLLRLSWDGEQVVQRDTPTVDFDGITVPLPPGAFLQATTDGEAMLRACVTEAVGSAGRILDLFAGCGTFALPLARNAAVHAIEALPAMLEALDQGWRRADTLKPVTTQARDLFRNPVLPEDLKTYDAIVIDPPRAGAEAQMAALAQSDVPVIAAVSCNPATFARDAKLLIAGGYRLDWVQVVDQFRWSTHVELVARFVKPPRPKR
ncbi:MAG: 23S rRNA (uracil1939-C5)-methyltransferase [Paracoccaceae bacterium]|jgi:23S rRNA (uracil1939-C5)-methyltransferase